MINDDFYWSEQFVLKAPVHFPWLWQMMVDLSVLEKAFWEY